MKAFIWSESLKTGAYHGDGSAIVVAPTLEEACELLAAAESAETETIYRWAQAAQAQRPDAVLDVVDTERPRIVAREVGCDC